MRELKLKTKYKHFKNKEYFTLCKSIPVDADTFSCAVGNP